MPTPRASTIRVRPVLAAVGHREFGQDVDGLMTGDAELTASGKYAGSAWCAFYLESAE